MVETRYPKNLDFLHLLLKNIYKVLPHNCKGAGRGIPRFNGTADNGSGSARCGAIDDGGSGSAHCGTVDDGQCGGRRHGRWTVQRAAAQTMDGAAGGGRQGHRAEDEHAAHTGARRERRLRRLRGKQGQRFWLQRLRGEARQTLGGERPYLCNLSPLPATHSHVLLHAQAPCGCHRPPSTSELHMALDMVPDGLPPIPIPVRGRIRQATDRGAARWRSVA